MYMTSSSKINRDNALTTSMTAYLYYHRSLKTNEPTFFISVFFFFIFISNLDIVHPKHPDASEEIPHYVIAKATYWRHCCLCSAQPVRYPKISTTRALLESGATTAASCRDADPHYTKENLIASQDASCCRIPDWKTVMLQDMPRNKFW